MPAIMDCRTSDYRQKQRQCAEFLFFVGYIIYLAWKVKESTLFAFPEGSRWGSVIHWSTFLILATSCLCRLRLDESAVMAGCMFLLGCIVKLTTGSILFVDFAVLFYASRSTDFRKIAIVTIIVLAIECSFVVLCSQIGIIEDHIWIRSNGKLRHGLGFRDYGRLFFNYVNVVTLYVYLRREKLNIFEDFLIITFTIVLFKLTRTKAPTIIILFLLIGSELCRIRYHKCMSSFIALVGRWSFTLCAILIIWATLSYNSTSKYWESLNNAVTGRLALSQKTIDKYGYTLFGQDIDVHGNALIIDEDGNFYTAKEINQTEGTTAMDTNYVDSAYLQILLYYGAVSLIFLLCVFYMALKRNRDLWVWLMVFSMALMALTEGRLVEIQVSTFLFWLWDSACRNAPHMHFGYNYRLISEKSHERAST